MQTARVLSLRKVAGSQIYSEKRGEISKVTDDNTCKTTNMQLYWKISVVLLLQSHFLLMMNVQYVKQSPNVHDNRILMYL